MLTEKGIENYCPLKEELRQWKDRKKKVQLPLFTSYVFVKINEREINEIRTLPNVVNFVYWLKLPAIIKEKEIEELKLFLEKYHHIVVEKTELKVGGKIEINKDNLPKGIATIVKIENNFVYLEFPILGIKLKTHIKEFN